MQRPVAAARARAQPIATPADETKQQLSPSPPLLVGSHHGLSGASAASASASASASLPSSLSASSSSCSSSWDSSSRDASLLLAYVLWGTLGIFGAHHFYLGRDKHAILWCSSFGGLGFGWFRDFFRLPAYVRLANRDWATCQMLRLSQRAERRPHWSFVHVVGQCLFAWWFGVLLCGCIDTWAGMAGFVGSGAGLAVEPVPVPDLTARAIALAVTSPHEPLSRYVLLRLIKMGARCLGVVAGVWLVGTVNSEQAANRGLIALASVVGQAYTLYEWQTRDRDAGVPKGPDDTPDDELTTATIDTSWYAILAATAVYHATRHWIAIPADPDPNQSQSTSAPSPPGSRSRSRSRRVGRSCRRLLVMMFACGLLLMSLGTYTLTCVSVESASGESVTLLEAWGNFVHSPAYRDLMAALGQLYQEWQQHGTRRTFERLKQEFDVDGTEHAYQVLQLPNDSDFQAVRGAHKRLILVWHPDKHPDKELATAKFQEIQHAYETLEKHLKHKHKPEPPRQHTPPTTTPHTNHNRNRNANSHTNTNRNRNSNSKRNSNRNAAG